MRPTPRSSGAAVWTGRFTGRRDPSCSPSAVPSGDALRAPLRSLKATACRRVSLFTPSVRSGEAVSYGEAALLASCYQQSLDLAAEYGLATIAFPAISCGVYGYPIREAAAIAVREVRNFLGRSDAVRKVYFACFGAAIHQAYLETLAAPIGAPE